MNPLFSFRPMNRKIQVTLTALTLSLSACQSLKTGADEGAPLPNIIFIMTDDQGYGDLGVTGNEYIRGTQKNKELAWSSPIWVENDEIFNSIILKKLK